MSSFKKIAVAAILGLAGWTMAQTPESVKAPPGPPGTDIGIDQNLNAMLPLDTEWTDEYGRKVKLGDYYKDKPVVLVPVFYGCKGICLAVMEGIKNSFNGIKAHSVGKDFEVVTFSIHPKETPEMALDLKREVLAMYNRPGAGDGWHFLVGDDDSIAALTKAIGFRYTFDRELDMISHPAGIMITTPDGKVSQYFIDVSYAPKLVWRAIEGAQQAKIGNLVEPIWFGCLSRNVATGAITVNVKRVVQIAAGLTLAATIIAIVFMTRKYRTTALRKPRPKEGA